MNNDGKPTLTSVINKHLDKRFGALAKCLPGNIVNYDEATETATIRLGVFRLVPSLTNPDLDEVEQLPDLFNVPIAWPRAQGYALVGTLEPGDPVAVHGLDRDISGWRRSNKASEPDDARTHRWTAAFAVPGLQADTGKFTTPSDAAALASKVETALDAIRNKLNALISVYATHIHADPVSGETGTPSATTTQLGDTAPVASAILKLES